MNPIKCANMIANPTTQNIDTPPFMVNNVVLPTVSETKLLGVYINSNLKWDAHINYLIKKVRKCFFILYRAKQFRFSLKTMFTLYCWFIRTSLEYAVPVWHSSITRKQSERLERVQRRCMRIIYGLDYPGYEEALARLKTTTLEKRRIRLCHRFAKGLLKSQRHRTLLPQGFQHGHDTRGRNRLLPSVKCRTARYANSTIPYLVRLLNGRN